MRQKILNYVKKWEGQGYLFGIPDAAHSRLEQEGKVPSYRLICKAIMKNDFALTSLGYSREQTPAYMMLKKIEIEARTK